MSMMATTKVAKAQLAQMVIEHPHLFPIPDYYMDSDSESNI